MILSLNIIFPSIVKRSFLVLFFLFLVAAYAISQTNQPEKPGKRRIEVNKAAEGIDEIEKITGKRVTRLIGDVSLTHNEVTMLCDSAFYLASTRSKHSAGSWNKAIPMTCLATAFYYDRMTEMAQ